MKNAFEHESSKAFFLKRYSGRSVFGFDGFQLRKTFFAHDLAPEKLCVIHTAAKDASGLIFFQNDGVFVYENFNGILTGEGEILSDFDGENDSSEFIDASDDSC